MVWRVASAVVEGADHARTGTPCQDAACVLVTRHGWLIAAASDGAGSASRSAEGARCAVHAATLHLAALAASGRLLAPEADAAALAGEVLATSLAALTSLAGPAPEAGSEGHPPGLRDLACTLLAVAVAPDGRGLALQLGDGAIVADAGDGPRCLFWPAKGEYANETVFVTSRNAAAHLVASPLMSGSRDLALLTDGLERLALDFAARAAFPAFFAPMFAAVRALPSGDAPASDALSAELAAFLSSPRVRAATGDDVTLVLATRDPA